MKSNDSIEQNTFDALMAQIRDCRICADAFGFEPHPVVRGNRAARILQVSQAPSRRAHLSGKPFDDASGRTLRQDWYQISDDTFYDPDSFYITAIGHCYPGKAPGGGDRPPPKHCAQRWLAQELDMADARLMIILGGHAATYFFGNVPLHDLVFADQSIGGRRTLVLPHPSPLNMRWFRDHPGFLSERIVQIRRAVHDALSDA